MGSIGVTRARIMARLRARTIVGGQARGGFEPRVDRTCCLRASCATSTAVAVTPTSDPVSDPSAIVGAVKVFISSVDGKTCAGLKACALRTLPRPFPRPAAQLPLRESLARLDNAMAE